MPRVTSLSYADAVHLPSETDLDRAAALLNAGAKVAILAGQGALGAAEELARTPDLLGAPVVKALLGKGVLPDDHPHVTGGIGLLGTRPSQVAAVRFHGRRGSLRDRGGGRLPRTAGDRVRGRRRAVHAAGRTGHDHSISAAREGGRGEGQQPRPDQVGADAVPGQRGV